MVGLSRSRFYDLIGTAFPHPLYSVKTHRPYYTPEFQQICLDVRQRNCGIDGKPVLFHRKGKEVAIPERSKRKPAADNRYKDMVDGLKSLGMAGVTEAQVEAVLNELHISGEASKHSGEVLKAVFLRLKQRQDTSAPAPTKKGDHHDAA